MTCWWTLRCHDILPIHFFATIFEHVIVKGLMAIVGRNTQPIAALLEIYQLS